MVLLDAFLPLERRRRPGGGEQVLPGAVGGDGDDCRGQDEPGVAGEAPDKEVREEEAAPGHGRDVHRDGGWLARCSCSRIETKIIN